MWFMPPPIMPAEHNQLHPELRRNQNLYCSWLSEPTKISAAFSIELICRRMKKAIWNSFITILINWCIDTLKKRKKNLNPILISKEQLLLLVSQAKSIKTYSLTPLNSRLCKEHLQINNLKNSQSEKRWKVEIRTANKLWKVIQPH